MYVSHKINWNLLCFPKTICLNAIDETRFLHPNLTIYTHPSKIAWFLCIQKFSIIRMHDVNWCWQSKLSSIKACCSILAFVVINLILNLFSRFMWHVYSRIGEISYIDNWKWDQQLWWLSLLLILIFGKN
jgi:hypothetical protein